MFHLHVLVVSIVFFLVKTFLNGSVGPSCLFERLRHVLHWFYANEQFSDRGVAFFELTHHVDTKELL